MKSVVLLVLVVVQLASAQYGFRPKTPAKQPFSFTYASNYQAALQQAQAEEKPILVLSHLTNCPACKNLKNDMAKNPGDIAELAKNFVVVHSLDNSDREVDNLGPSNHRYYPRVFFYGRNGRIIPKISNANQPKYPYYYSTTAELSKSMRDVINGNQY